MLPPPRFQVHHPFIMPNLCSIPNEVLKHLLGYVRDPRSLAATERSCRKLRSCVADDQVWIHMPGSTDYCGASHRDNAFIHTILSEIAYLQKNGEDNVILEVLSDASALGRAYEFRRIVSNVLVAIYGPHYRENMQWEAHIRGDTIGYMAAMVQAYLLRKMHAVNRVSVFAATKAGAATPEVTRGDIELVEMIDYPLGIQPLSLDSPWMSSPGYTSYLGTINWSDTGLLNASVRFRIARRLTMLCGIVKITDEALAIVANDMLYLIGLLLMHVYVSQVPYFRDYAIQLKHYIPPDELIHDWFHQCPPSILKQAEGIDGPFNYYVCTVVPSHVKLVAELIHGFPSHIYGAPWVAVNWKTPKDEQYWERLKYSAMPIPLESDEDKGGGGETDNDGGGIVMKGVDEEVSDAAYLEEDSVISHWSACSESLVD